MKIEDVITLERNKKTLCIPFLSPNKSKSCCRPNTMWCERARARAKSLRSFWRGPKHVLSPCLRPRRSCGGTTENDPSPCRMRFGWKTSVHKIYRINWIEKQNTKRDEKRSCIIRVYPYNVIIILYTYIILLCVRESA